MARILIDLSETQLQALAAKVRTEGRSRAAIIRDAIDAYLAHHAPGDASAVFGLWRDRPIDGLEYQEAQRAEW
ncbi:CopG family transcriptional regulator [Castellaniella ginsengisoli]|uniref:CopG family transcriptional regulator n=1 Tax=Castellaniella ginsengisoli TaxID=546114 RepID=A0AB39DJY1_9BURK